MFQVSSFKLSRLWRDPVATGQVFPPLAGSRCDGTSFKRKSAGFSLVELLVSIFIIITLLATALLNYRKGEKALALERAAYKLAQDIRRAEEMAMESEDKKSSCGDINDPNNKFHYTFGLTFSTSSNCSEQMAPCKYRYILFADCNGNDTYQWQPDADFSLNLTDFQYVQVSSLNGFSNDVAFKPPDPIVIIDGKTDIAQASIVISLRDDPTKTKTVRINKAGLIEVY